ncbi:MAG: hypothetical protein QOD77_482 [Thermoplasmata archaeon]|jgi:hypothetical protein|nr:hypothetical protein [Thermoplasmata archaeon]
MPFPVGSMINGHVRRSLWAFAAVLAGAGAILLLAAAAEASHFRGGTMYAMPSDDDPLNVTFEGRIAFKATYFGLTSGSCVTGGYVSITGSDDLYFGDGGSSKFKLQITSCNWAEDWFVGKMATLAGVEGINHTYPAPTNGGSPWLAYWESSARLGTNHINNPNIAWRLESEVDLADPANNPVRPFVPPVVQCTIATVCNVPIPFADDDVEDVHTLRWATSAEATGGSTFYQPGPCPGCGGALAATLDPTDHYIEWDTTGAALSSPRTYYSTQVMIEDGRAKVPMDFLIQLVDGERPYWVTPPSPCGEKLAVLQGATLEFTVEAKSDDIERIIEILALEFPKGAVITIDAPGNPTRATLRWDTTADTALGNYLAIFFAQDDIGLQATICSVNILVVPRPELDFTWVFTTTAPKDLTLDQVAFYDRTKIGGHMAHIPRSYLWTFSDPRDPATATLQDPQHMFRKAAVYEVCMKLTFHMGKDYSDMVCHEVRVNNRPPDAKATLLSVTGARATYTDDGFDADGTVVAWGWNFADGGFGESFAMGHEFYKPGTYLVCVTVTDDNGATASDCVPTRIEIPQQRTDTDLDGVVDSADNCPELSNRDQADGDRNGIGDACQPLLPPRQEPPQVGAVPQASAGADQDSDGVADAADNCVAAANRDQSDLDRDNLGDACDLDVDGDGAAQAGSQPDAILDNCPRVANDQRDGDGDGVGDACDLDGVQAALGLPRTEELAGPAEMKQAADSPLPWFIGVGVGLALAALAAVLCVWAVRRWE